MTTSTDQTFGALRLPVTMAAKTPAISLWQPWASALLVPEFKVHETRHWAAPARLIGQRFAIHAAARPIPRDLDEDVAGCMAEGFGPDWRRTLPRGALVGTALLASCRRMDQTGPEHTNDADFGYWSPDRYAWRIEEPQAFAEPIAFKGHQGWFQVELPA